MSRRLGQNRSVLLPAGAAAAGLLCLGLAVKNMWPPAQTIPISESQLERGRQVYQRTCFVCHQPDGRGLPDQMPPLAKSDYLMADKERSIRIILGGQTGKIVVNRKTYSGVMLPLYFLSDTEVADVLTYVRNSFGNAGPAVSPEEVRRVRAIIPPPEANPDEVGPPAADLIPRSKEPPCPALEVPPVAVALIPQPLTGVKELKQTRP